MNKKIKIFFSFSIFVFFFIFSNSVSVYGYEPFVDELNAEHTAGLKCKSDCLNEEEDTCNNLYPCNLHILDDPNDDDPSCPSWYSCMEKSQIYCQEKCFRTRSVDDNYFPPIDSEDFYENGNGFDNSNNTSGSLGIGYVNLPINPDLNISPCIGETPKNANLCPNDGKEIFYYTEKNLVEFCSKPEGSEPKCEYVCKTDYLDNGTCKEEGFFMRVINWFKELI